MSSTCQISCLERDPLVKLDLLDDWIGLQLVDSSFYRGIEVSSRLIESTYGYFRYRERGCNDLDVATRAGTVEEGVQSWQFFYHGVAPV